MTAWPLRILSLSLLSAVAVLSLLSQADAGNTFDTQSLLGESYAGSAQFELQDKVDFMARLTRVAADLGDTRAQAWCEELFTLASSPNMPANWSRLAGEKNALISLAKVNPARAMQLWPSFRFTGNPSGQPESPSCGQMQTYWPLMVSSPFAEWPILSRGWQIFTARKARRIQQ